MQMGGEQYSGPVHARVRSEWNFQEDTEQILDNLFQGHYNPAAEDIQPHR